MRGSSSRRCAVLFALVSSLVLVLGAGTAVGGPGSTQGSSSVGESRHPSGKDRTVEKGGSGTQGKSTSDPDGASNGGADKPGGSGGVYSGDQDGNNGCGNDQDFEDDNNGNCGRPAGVGGGNTPDVEGDIEEDDDDDEEQNDDGDQDADDEGGAVGSNRAGSSGGARVLGTRFTRGSTAEGAVAGVTLTRTGTNLDRLVMFASILLLFGALLRLADRARRLGSR